MPKFIDNFLNQITMYRLILYYLIGLWLIAVFFSIAGILPYRATALLFSAFFITVICGTVNKIFAIVYKAPTNMESLYITAFILVLIITPNQPATYLQYLSLAGWAAVWAMASKFIFAYGNKHLFNPAAFAVALTSLALNQSATWWIGTAPMAIFVVIGGILIVRKIRRLDLVLSFFAVSLVLIFGYNLLRGQTLAVIAQRSLFTSPILFFAFVMLTEPLTTPPTRKLRIWYGAVTGLLFAPFIHLGSIYSTPELALLAGNIFSYAVSPKTKLILKLKEITQIAADTFDFWFESARPFVFKPGQYLEWTLGHAQPDSRGNRRYFTIASSPTEAGLRIGVKFYDHPSSFKKNLALMKTNDEIVASQLAGDFTLPSDPRQKLVLIAGGIGITPFRSMIKYLLDTKEKRDIVLLYSNKNIDDIAYKEILDQAEQQLGIKVIYILTNTAGIPKTWLGQTGYISAQMITKEIPDYRDRLFYVSGPRSMVLSAIEAIKFLNIRKDQIKTDFFPGFA